MALVIIALIVFGIGTTALVQWTIKQPSGIKIAASILFIATFVLAIGWALKEFSNQN